MNNIKSSLDFCFIYVFSMWFWKCNTSKFHHDFIDTLYSMWKNSVPKLCEMIGGNKTKFYCQGTICWRCVLAVLWTENGVWLRLEIKQNHWSVLEKKDVFHTNLEQMFKGTTTELNTQLTTTQQRLTCVLKNIRSLPDCCYCLNSMGNKILFRINWRHVNQGFNVVWGLVTWGAKPLSRLIQSSDCCRWRWDVLRPDMQSALQPCLAGTTCFSWLMAGYPPAFLVAFPLNTLGKSLPWAVGVTSKFQSESH